MSQNNLTPIPESNNSISVFLPSEDKELENDIIYARQNVQTLIETGIEGARQLADIADQSQQSVAYERLGGLLKTVSDLNKDLVALSKSKKDLRNPGPQESDNGKTVNNLFVGSTAEMAELIAQMEKKNNA